MHFSINICNIGPFAGLMTGLVGHAIKISRHTVVLGEVGLFVQEL